MGGLELDAVSTQSFELFSGSERRMPRVGLLKARVVRRPRDGAKAVFVGSALTVTNRTLIGLVIGAVVRGAGSDGGGNGKQRPTGPRRVGRVMPVVSPGETLAVPMAVAGVALPQLWYQFLGASVWRRLPDLREAAAAASTATATDSANDTFGAGTPARWHVTLVGAGTGFSGTESGLRYVRWCALAR